MLTEARVVNIVVRINHTIICGFFFQISLGRLRLVPTPPLSNINMLKHSNTAPAELTTRQGRGNVVREGARLHHCPSNNSPKFIGYALFLDQ